LIGHVAFGNPSGGRWTINPIWFFGLIPHFSFRWRVEAIYRCWRFGIEVSRVPVARVPVASVTVARVPVSRVPVARVPVASVPVARVPVSRVPVARVPVASVPVARVTVARVTVARVPVARVPVARVPVARVRVSHNHLHWLSSHVLAWSQRPVKIKPAGAGLSQNGISSSIA